MIDSGMQAVLAQLVVLRLVMQVHVRWMQRCLYKAGGMWAHRDIMFGLVVSGNSGTILSSLLRGGTLDFVFCAFCKINDL